MEFSAMGCRDQKYLLLPFFYAAQVYYFTLTCQKCDRKTVANRFSERR